MMFSFTGIVLTSITYVRTRDIGKKSKKKGVVKLVSHPSSIGHIGLDLHVPGNRDLS